MQPVAAPDDGQKKVLVITNDSTVFLANGPASAFEMFGGRMTEVKNLVARLDKVCNVSFAVISGRFGFVPGNFVILPYDSVPETKEDFEALQKAKDYYGKIEYISRAFDRVVICVPKACFSIIADALPFGKVTAVTNPMFEGLCGDRAWTYLERRGARVGAENAEAILREIEGMSASQ